MSGTNGGLKLGCVVGVGREQWCVGEIGDRVVLVNTGEVRRRRRELGFGGK
jgi:hypothetical protein